ncbi:hypothetical protein LLG10_00360 [bacterium]|nr:hypothetical protein [bacterium]
MRNISNYLDGKRNDENKLIKSIFIKLLLLIIIFFASACSGSAPIVNEPNQNQNDTGTINSNIPQNEETNNEQLIFEISSNNIENTPTKTWKPLWQYTAQNKGSMVVKNILIESQQCLLINNPLIDYDYYQRIIPPNSFYDDIFVLKPETKQKLWQYRINSICGRNTLIQDDCIFIGTSQGPMGYDDKFFMFCINKNNGKEIWRCSINGVTETNMVILNKRLFFGVSGYDGNFIYCVDAQNGNMIYQCNSPRGIVFDYKIEFISIEDLLYFSDPKTSCIYSFNPNSQQFSLVYQNPLETFGGLAYFNKYLLFESTTQNSFSSLCAIKLSDNKLDWVITFKNREYNYLRKPIVKENLVYFDSYGFIACIDMKTKQLLWSFADPVHDIQEFILDDDRVFIGMEQEPYEARDTEQYYRRYILSLDANTGKVNWKMQKGVRLSCIYQDKILLTDENNLYMIEAN